MAAARVRLATGHRVVVEGKWRLEGRERDTTGLLLLRSGAPAAAVKEFAKSLGQVKKFQTQKEHNKVRRKAIQKKRRAGQAATQEPAHGGAA